MRHYFLSGGRSFYNGIMFFSPKSREEGIWTSENACTCCEWQSSNILTHKQERVLSIIISAIFILSVYCGILLKWNIIQHIRIVLLDFILSFISAYIVANSNIKKAAAMFRFHGAEHMAINCYEDLGRIPTLEEIKRYSRFSDYCGSNLFTVSFIYLLANFLCTFFNSILISGMSLLIFVPLLDLFKISGILNYFQIFFTNKPTDKELKIAIQGLIKWEKVYRHRK